MLRPAAFALALLLAACGPKHLKLADGQCLTPKVGDTVNGVATLHSYAGLGCIECGAYLTQAGCTGNLGFRAGTDDANRQYDRITKHRTGEDPDGPVERRVFVSGPIIPNGATGAPMLNADHLTSAM